MSSRNEEHFLLWFQKSRSNLKLFRERLPEMDKSEKLKAISVSYSRIAALRYVCTGDAFFTGSPQRPVK